MTALDLVSHARDAGGSRSVGESGRRGAGTVAVAELCAEPGGVSAGARAEPGGVSAGARASPFGVGAGARAALLIVEPLPPGTASVSQNRPNRT
jgi:hypothetical protein